MKDINDDTNDSVGELEKKLNWFYWIKDKTSLEFELWW